MSALRHIALAAIAGAVASSAIAHGPQIQITLNGLPSAQKITTRELILDGPYSGVFPTAPKSVYMMPVREHLGAWHSRPNAAELLPGVPEFYSGPGFAYGWESPVVDASQPPFPLGSNFAVRFIDGLKRWNGAAFVDPGAAEVEGFTSSAVIKTVDGSESSALQFPGGAGVAFNLEAHSTVRYRFLGDGVSTAVAPADGVYLLSLQLSNTGAPNEVAPLRESDPFYFVLSKGGSAPDVAAAVRSLGVDPNRVQNLIPEPATGLLVGLGLLGLSLRRRRGFARAGRS